MIHLQWFRVSHSGEGGGAWGVPPIIVGRQRLVQSWHSWSKSPILWRPPILPSPHSFFKFCPATHINIYLHHLLCAHSRYLYYTEWRIHWYQKFTFHNVFSFQNLFTCKSHILWLNALRLCSFCVILMEMV